MFEGLLQPAHLLAIFGIALLVFGPQKLPELVRGSEKAFKSAINQEKNPPDNTKATASND